MTLIPWRKKNSVPVTRQSSPPGPTTEFKTELNRLFDRFFTDPWSSPIGWGEDAGWPAQDFVPSVDVAENDKKISVRAEIPGMDPENVDINVSGNILTIHGEKRESKEDERDDFYHCERRFGSFTRRVELPSTADLDTIEAEQSNGVLTISIEKLPTAKAKRIEVKDAHALESVTN
ncbi:MAG: Hsp20/alpha crystallin family protein [Planctomycetota bacterium]|jgi:HSP20 family protein